MFLGVFLQSPCLRLGMMCISQSWGLQYALGKRVLQLQ